MADESSKGPVVQAVSEGNLELVTSPHSHFGWTTARIMWTVTIALVPSLASAGRKTPSA